MKKAKTDKAKREAAVERVLAGHSTITREALRLHVSKQAVAGWVTSARKNRSDPLDQGMREKNTDAPSSSSDVHGARAERLKRARQSAGIDGPPEDGSEQGGTFSGTDDDSASIPAPSPEELVALCETFRALGMRTYAGILGVDLEDPRVVATFTFTEGEKIALRMSAPYATKYVPALIGESDVAGAIAFVGVLTLSMVNASAAIRAVAKEEEARTVAAEDPRTQGSSIGTTKLPRAPFP